MQECDAEGARGLVLRLCTWGEALPGRLPTLILHGYLEQGAAWDDVARRLGGRIVAPDHRGHGRSGHVGIGGGYHFWDYAADVEALVRGLGGRVDLVGHSMGGTIATQFAACRPDAVRRLVLVEGLGPPDFTPMALERSRGFLDAVTTPPTHAPLADLDAAVARMRRNNPRLDDPAARRLAARITEPAQGGGLRWTWDPLHRAPSPNPFDPRQFRIWVQAVTAPVLYLSGADSPFVVPDLAERLGWLRDVTSRVIPAAGHLVHHDAPEALAAEIAAWFAR